MHSHKCFNFIILIITLTSSVVVKAQSPKSVDYFTSIKNHDLTKLWRGDIIQIEGDGEKIPFPEPLGYIGDNYQRFYIHYISVSKSKENPYQYIVYGKTKVKENICRFNGTITVKKAILYKESEDPRYKQGSVFCDVLFYEDSTQQSSGYFKGVLTSEFTINKNGILEYDALLAGADGYFNNQCKTNWISYKTGKSKKCNWGDDRIPDSNDLDVGAGEFIINNKYVKNGWQTFSDAYGPESKNSAEALKIEQRKWWE